MEAILSSARRYVSDIILNFLIEVIDRDKDDLVDLAICGDTSFSPQVGLLKKRVLGRRNPFYYSASPEVRGRYNELRKVTGEFIAENYSLD